MNTNQAQIMSAKNLGNAFKVYISHVSNFFVFFWRAASSKHLSADGHIDSRFQLKNQLLGGVSGDGVFGWPNNLTETWPMAGEMTNWGKIRWDSAKICCEIV